MQHLATVASHIIAQRLELILVVMDAVERGAEVWVCFLGGWLKEKERTEEVREEWGECG